MGQGYNSCINLNNWNHLFNPNGEAAQQGALNCFEHWARSSGNEGQSTSTPPVRIFDTNGKSAQRAVMYAPGYEPKEEETKTVEQEAREKTARFFAAIVVIVIVVFAFSRIK